jgi:predicted ATPase
MIRRIAISGYKSLRNVDIELEPLTVLLGPNGAGKSNVLDAMHLLARMATMRSLDEAFDAPHRGSPLESFAWGPGGIRALRQAGSARMEFEIDLQVSPASVRAVAAAGGQPADGNGEGVGPKAGDRLRYRLGVELATDTGFLRVDWERLDRLKRDWTPHGSRKSLIETTEDSILVRDESRGRPLVYDRGLPHTILSVPQYAPHHPHVVALREEFESWVFYYLEPRERMRTPSPLREVREIGPMGEDLPSYLKTLRTDNFRQFTAVERVLAQVVPGVTGVDVRTNDLGQAELFITEDAAEIPASVVSEGTLRVLGLLALCSRTPSPGFIGFEEPENGIHPGRVQKVAELLTSQAEHGGAQLIVTTHSPLLADALPLKALYRCWKEDGATQVEPLLWRAEPLLRGRAITDALQDGAASGEDAGRTVSELILRGDLDD